MGVQLVGNKYIFLVGNKYIFLHITNHVCINQH